MGPRARPATIAGTATGAPSLIRRAGSLILVLLSMMLILVGKIDEPLVDRARRAAIDVTVPILAVISRPVTAVRTFVHDTRALWSTFEDNRRLRAENAQLRRWYQAAVALDRENTALRGLLSFPAGGVISETGGRVVGDPGGAYARSLLINLGTDDGLAPGQAVVDGTGLLGRVVDAGRWSARILLITDLNSRIPVVLEGNGHRAILGGDNGRLPRLMYLAHEAEASPGDRILTSGIDGVLPPGLVVGTIARRDPDGTVWVRPAADLDGAELVRVLGFPSDHPLLRAGGADPALADAGASAAAAAAVGAAATP